MGEPIDISQLTDADLCEEFVNRKLLSPGQLKAALDYQSSVGGKVCAVISKLGLVKEEALRDFLRRLASGEDFIVGEEPAKKPPPPPEFDVAKLRVHKKLIEKVPSELVEKFGILFFFPPPGSRTILMSSAPRIAPEGIDKLHSLLGVEIQFIDLFDDERAKILDGEKPSSRMLGGAPGGPSPRRADPEDSRTTQDSTLQALVSNVQGTDAAPKAPSGPVSEEDALELAIRTGNFPTRRRVDPAACHDSTLDQEGARREGRAPRRDRVASSCAVSFVGVVTPDARSRRPGRAKWPRWSRLVVTNRRRPPS